MNKKRRHRMYILWFAVSCLWLAVLAVHIQKHDVDGSLMFLQILNAAVAFAAGMVNRNSYKKDISEDAVNV